MQSWKEKALKDFKTTEAYFKKIRRKPPKQLDEVMDRLHEEVFAKTDCLQCANCCKTTSPIFRDKDIERIARHLGMRPADMVSRYLHIDVDGDYVLNEAPCPFLGADNYCSIYEVRPKACSAYPHTNRKNFHQILSLTLNNTLVCPATYSIIKQLQAELPG
jgi:uncharacterized protein